MNLTKQLNEKECGICVINSFIEHYFGYSNKDDLLSEANLNESGLNIAEFERLCINHKLSPSSYEIEFDEFKNLDTKKAYFVLLLNINSTNHYVIAKKLKNTILIYDSFLGIYEWTYYELKKHFLNVYIKIDKQSNSTVKLDCKFSLMNIKPLILISNILCQLLIGGLAIASGLFLNFVLDLCSVNLEIKTLVLICCIFVIIDIFKNMIQYLYNYYINRYVFLQYKVIKYNTIHNLMNKKSSFINKIDINYLYILNETIYYVIKFNVDEYASLIANILISLTTFCISLFYSWYFIFVFIFAILIETLFLVFNLNKQVDLVDKKLKTNTDLNKINTIFIKDINSNYNAYIYQKLYDKLQKYYYNTTFNDYQIQTFNNLVASTKSSLLNLVEIIATFISVILVNKNKNFNIGNMLFSLSTIKIFIDSFSSLIGFKIKYESYSKLYDIFSMIYNVDNIVNNSTKTIEKVNNVKLKFNKKEYLLKNPYNIPIKLDKFVNILSNRSDQNEIEVTINDISVKNINQDYLNKTICYFNEKFKFKLFDECDLNLLKNNPQIIYFLEEINNNYNLNEENKIKINNILLLITAKDKIIIFNHYFDDLPKELVNLIKTKIFNEIQKHNYLIFL